MVFFPVRGSQNKWVHSWCMLRGSCWRGYSSSVAQTAMNLISQNICLMMHKRWNTVFFLGHWLLMWAKCGEALSLISLICFLICSQIVNYNKWMTIIDWSAWKGLYDMIPRAAGNPEDIFSMHNIPIPYYKLKSNFMLFLDATLLTLKYLFGYCFASALEYCSKS